MRKKLFTLCMTAVLSIVSTTAWALSKVDGFYQISSPADFAEFAALVNGGEKKAYAILTADIDLGTDIDTYKLYDGEYVGTFDGAGHTITINFSDGTKDDQGPALFRSIGNRALIKRLKVQGTITTTRQHAAAITNYSGGVIRDCWADVIIKCPTALTDASAAAFVGQCNKNSLIENCVAKIAIDAPGSVKFGGVAAWSDAQRTHIANCLVLNQGNFDTSDGKSAGLVRNDANLEVVNLETYNADSYHNRPAGAVANNYVLDNWGGENKGTTVVTASDVVSGKICFMLNSDQSQIRWTQNLGTDDYPVPAVFRPEGQVYASAATNCQGKAEGEVTFSNTPSNAVTTAHTCDKYGVCTTCGQFNWNSFDFDDPNRYDPIDRSFLISSGDDLFLAEGWNRLQNGCKFNLKLVNDVTCTPPTGQLIFNNSDWSECSFNGQGHELTIEMVDIPDQFPAFLPKPYAYAEDFVFENVIMHGKITSTYTGGSPFAGSICSREYGNNKKIVRNVFSDININTKRVGDNSCGGLMGCADGKVAIENSIYAGNIVAVEGAECLGGLCGWTSGANTSLTNCAFLGTLTNAGGDSHTLARNYGNIPCDNVYSINVYGAGDEAKYTRTTAAAVESGELAFKLNGSQNGVERFYQVIGTDLMPMPIAKDGALVYLSGYCGEVGNPIGYTNTPTGGEPTVTPHQFENGWCSVCGEWDENFMTPVDGWFNISNGAELAWWSIYESKNAITNARLTADIDMEGYMEKFVVIGTTSKLYTGTFDGQGHVISNFKYAGGDYSGLFGAIGGGAVIKNFVLDNTCSILGNAFCGIIGGTNGSGDVYLSNLGNEGTVTGAAQNVCGILGVDMGGSATLNISNCYVTGAVKGNRESATICGWSNGSSRIVNCYSIASLQGIYQTGSFTRGSASCINCYEIETVGKQDNITKITNEDITSGVLCFKLNDNKDGLDRFYQKLGTDAYPTTIAKEDALVYSIAESYRCDGQPMGSITGYANTPAEIGLPEHDFEDGACNICSTIETDAEGYAKIINTKCMVALATRVNEKGDTDLKARMYADLDMSGVAYIPVGTETNLYKGEFDGQNHIISNFVIESNENYTGLFGRIGDGAVIKNLVLDNTCSIKGKSFTGLVGGTNGGGDVYLTNLGNEGPVTGTAENASGILGVDMNGTATLHITNCYVTGAVKGARESAVICSWSNAASVIENCWSIATLEGKYGDEDSFTRGSAACVNCYEIEGVGTQNNKTGANRTNLITAEEVANGALAYKLNTPAFGQTIGTDAHPVFDAPAVSYVGEAGYATLYDTTTGYELNGDVQAYAANIINDYWIKLAGVDNVPANTPVILKGTYYNKVAADLNPINIANDLKGTAEETEAAGKYILAQPEGEPVGFYLATTGTIAAGKAYLEGAAGIKAFFFECEDATGIEGLNTQDTQNAQIFNIAGQRVSKLQKGINIVGGKKILK